MFDFLAMYLHTCYISFKKYCSSISDRGVYIPTVALCFLFFYVEVAVRFRDPKCQPLGIDLCRPFAAHW